MRLGKERKGKERKEDLRGAAANLSVEGHNASTKYSSKIRETERKRKGQSESCLNTKKMLPILVLCDTRFSLKNVSAKPTLLKNPQKTRFSECIHHKVPLSDCLFHFVHLHPDILCFSTLCFSVFNVLLITPATCLCSSSCVKASTEQRYLSCKCVLLDDIAASVCATETQMKKGRQRKSDVWFSVSGIKEAPVCLQISAKWTGK